METKKASEIKIRHFTSDGTEFTGNPIPITPRSIQAFKIAFSIAAKAQKEKEGENAVCLTLS